MIGKRSLFKRVLAIGLLISACKVDNSPATSAPSLPVEIPGPSPTPTLSPSTISGEFVLTNTSAPSMEVGIETMAIVLEYRLSTADPWKKVEVDCSFDPPAPLVLKKELIVQYECQFKKQLPLNAEVHTTAEVRIHGSDEVFKLQVNSP